jgi:DNA-binding HxlR family transcriptional regulator
MGFLPKEAGGNVSGDAALDDGVRQIMSRTVSVLDPTGRDNITDTQREIFEFLAVQVAAYEGDRNCPIVTVVHHIGNYWRHWLLLIMRTGSYRPSTIMRLLEAVDPTHPISHRMLTLNLRLLERDGLIERKVISGEIKHVEYSATLLGQELSDQILQFLDWAERRSPEIIQARAQFDADDSRAASSMTFGSRPALHASGR